MGLNGSGFIFSCRFSITGPWAPTLKNLQSGGMAKSLRPRAEAARINPQNRREVGWNGVEGRSCRSRRVGPGMPRSSDRETLRV